MGFNSHSVFLMQDFKVKSIGANIYGQLGNGAMTDAQTQFQNISLNRVKKVVVGEFYTFFLMQDGTVRSVGGNAHGQLGNGTVSGSPAWGTSVIQTPNLQNVKDIVCGGGHTIFLMQDGSIKAVGYNAYGQLSNGTAVTPQPAIQTISISGVKQIACGYWHTMFLMNDGTVKSVGNNEYGQLGIGNTISKNSPQNLLISGVKQIACGKYYTMFLMMDGSIKAVGDNGFGQLGVESGMNQFVSIVGVKDIGKVKQVSCGENHTMFLMQDGTVKGVGYNPNGQIGDGTTSTKSVIQVAKINGVKEIACGARHTVFLMNDGTVKSVGSNTKGELGDSSITNRSSIVTTSLTGVKSLWESLGERQNFTLIKQASSYKRYLPELKRVLTKDSSYIEGGTLYRTTLHKQAKALTLN